MGSSLESINLYLSGQWPKDGRAKTDTPSIFSYILQATDGVFKKDTQTQVRIWLAGLQSGVSHTVNEAINIYQIMRDAQFIHLHTVCQTLELLELFFVHSAHCWVDCHS